MSVAQPSYPRDLIGYGETSPDAKWPSGARLAQNFVVNYEDDGENSMLQGDAASEAYLTEIVGISPFENQRNQTIESLYEYGCRGGVWRLLDLFRDKGLPFSSFAVYMALQRRPEVVRRMLRTDMKSPATAGAGLTI